MPRRAPPPPQTGRLLFYFLLLLMMTVAVAATIESSCPPSGYPCAPPCAPHSTTTTTHQCLHYLTESHKHEVCSSNMPPGRRRDVFAALRLRNCCEHRVDRALPEAAFHGGKQCHRHVQDLIQLDEDAATASCTHINLLRRYDCTQNYSIAHDCHDCKVAYRRWICSELIPHYHRPRGVQGGTQKNSGGTGGAGASQPSNGAARGEFLVRPCPSVCQKVEEQCPYLVPDQTLTPAEMAHPTPQYAGEPTFLCLDLNIPRLEQHATNGTAGHEDCCYTHCGTPGRGTGAGNIADKGGGTHRQHYTEVMTSVHELPWALDICEHCPGRPDTAAQTAEPGAPTDGASGGGGNVAPASATVASLAAASSSASIVKFRTNTFANTFLVFYTMLLLSLYSGRTLMRTLTEQFIEIIRLIMVKIKIRVIVVRADDLKNCCCFSDKEHLRTVVLTTETSSSRGGRSHRTPTKQC